MNTGNDQLPDQVLKSNFSEARDNILNPLISYSGSAIKSICRPRRKTKSKKMDPEKMDSLVKMPELPECSDEVVEPAYESNESSINIACQISGPLLIAGICMVFAGIYLEMLSQEDVFIKVPEIIILVPALLGLKGNLEMTLASRLSTEANLGTMDDCKEMWSMVFGNLSLVQCQAIIVGLLSSLVAIIYVIIYEQKFILSHALLLCASTIMTASVASFFLGVLTCAVVVLSTYININPDNVATPIAAGLGDITALLLLSLFASFLNNYIDSNIWLAVAIILLFLSSLPLWIWVAKNNKHTKKVLTMGWIPIVLAMLISMVGGVALEIFIKLYPAIPAFQPVINGVGGNLVSIQASRLSTALHKKAQLGQLPPEDTVCRPPCQIFQTSTTHSQSSRVLMFLVIPSHLFFCVGIMYLKNGEIKASPLFFIMYLSAALLQVGLLLFICYILTFYLWKKKINPDNTSIPYLTAIGDLLGILLLGLAFSLVNLLGYDSLE